jgi:hypothetical protein
MDRVAAVLGLAVGLLVSFHAHSDVCCLLVSLNRVPLPQKTRSSSPGLYIQTPAEQIQYYMIVAVSAKHVAAHHHHHLCHRRVTLP